MTSAQPCSVPQRTKVQLAPCHRPQSAMVTSIAEPMASVYSATKAALRSLGRSFASELAPRIRVNTVSPGPIATPIFGKLGLSADVIEGFAKDMTQRNPLKRIGEPADIAKAALYLLSDQSAYVTGIELHVDGPRENSSALLAPKSGRAVTPTTFLGTLSTPLVLELESWL